jgi:hypothetical protein
MAARQTRGTPGGWIIRSISDDASRDPATPPSDSDPEPASVWASLFGERRSREIQSSKHLAPWQAGVVIAAVLAADYAGFRLVFDANYFDWYLANGAAFALALSAFSIVIELDDEPGLIAAEPNTYLASWFAFLGISFEWLRHAVEAPGRTRWEALDWPFTALFAITWVVAVGAWILIIVPALYLVTLVAGAPVRRTQASQSTTSLTETTADRTTSTTFWIDANIRERPVTATNALAAALLYGISFVI